MLVKHTEKLPRFKFLEKLDNLLQVTRSECVGLCFYQVFGLTLINTWFYYVICSNFYGPRLKKN